MKVTKRSSSSLLLSSSIPVLLLSILLISSSQKSIFFGGNSNPFFIEGFSPKCNYGFNNKIIKSKSKLKHTLATAATAATASTVDITNMIMMMTTKDNDTTTTPTTTPAEESNTNNKEQTTLASSYVIHMNSSNNGKKEQSMIWTLTPIAKAIGKVGVQEGEGKGDSDGDEKTIGVGTMAIQALKSTHKSATTNNNDKSSIQLVCDLVEKKSEEENNDDVIGIEISIDFTMDGGSSMDQDADMDALIHTLSRVMIQKKLKEYQNQTSLSKATPVSVSLPQSISAESEIYNSIDLLSSSGYPIFYQPLLTSKNVDLSSLEMSDMVDSNGNILGSVPRLLVHKFNLLHRGIGIVVCRDGHITKDDFKEQQEKILDVYCHRRTDTKRIFPSLYDMFVGGVSISGENSKLTAAREVAEELGLGKALELLLQDNDAVIDDSSSPLSDPLFKCTVCTSYNRCVVTLFTYKYTSGEDAVKWQEEEVSWGDFVPYDIVEQAAALSINKLVQSGQWPGIGDDDLESSILKSAFSSKLLKEGEDNIDASSLNWREWDFVPDGLLVWMAWLQWLQK